MGPSAGTFRSWRMGREVVDALGPLFAHSPAWWRMGAAGAGQMAKLCNQVVVAGTVGAVSEAVLLARRAGLDVAALLEVLGGGLAASELLAEGLPVVEEATRAAAARRIS